MSGRVCGKMPQHHQMLVFPFPTKDWLCKQASLAWQEYELINKVYNKTYQCAITDSYVQ